MLDYKKVVDRFQKNLEYEISQQTNEHSLAFMLHHYAKGNMTDEDCIELRGYYKGLRVAREMMQRVIAMEQEESGDFDEEM